MGCICWHVSRINRLQNKPLITILRSLSVYEREVRMMQENIEIPREKIADFCERWKISEFAFFGSILRADWRPESDVDVLVTFTDDAHWGLFDLVHMEQELQQIFGREVDLVSRRGIEGSRNYLRRHSILSNAEVVHVASINA